MKIIVWILNVLMKFSTLALYNWRREYGAPILLQMAPYVDSE